MPAPLAEDARAYLKAQGAPISKFNLDNAMQELTNDPSLRPSYSSDNRMLSAMGGVTGTPDTSKYPGMKPQAGSNIGQFANETGPMRMTDPDYLYEGARSSDLNQGTKLGSNIQQSGSEELNRHPERIKPTQQAARRMADRDLRSGGTAGGASPGTPSQSVSTENVRQTELAPPKAQAPAVNDRAELNGLAASKPKPRPPAAAGAGQGGNEAQAARPQPAPPAGPRLQAPELPPVDVNRRQTPDPALVAAAQPAGGLNPVGAADLSSGIGAYNPAVGQTAQGLPPTPSAGGSMIDSIMGMLPEGTGDRAQNVLGVLGPIGMAMLGGRMMGGGGGARPAPGPMMRSPSAPLGMPMRPGVAAPSMAAPPATMPPNALVPSPVPGGPPPGLTKTFQPQPPMAPMAPTPEAPLPQMPPASPQTMGDMQMSRFGPVGVQSAPRLPSTGGMTLSDAQSAYQGGPVGQALSAAAPKAAPKAPAPRPGGGRPAPKRAENKERTAKRKARTAKGNQG